MMPMGKHFSCIFGRKICIGERNWWIDESKMNCIMELKISRQFFSKYDGCDDTRTHWASWSVGIHPSGVCGQFGIEIECSLRKDRTTKKERNRKLPWLRWQSIWLLTEGSPVRARQEALTNNHKFRDGVVGNISACHADARGSIPRHGASLLFFSASKKTLEMFFSLLHLFGNCLEHFRPFHKGIQTTHPKTNGFPSFTLSRTC